MGNPTTNSEEEVQGPVVPTKKKPGMKMTDHPFFGMSADDSQKSVQEEMDELRGLRNNATSV